MYRTRTHVLRGLGAGLAMLALAELPVAVLASHAGAVHAGSPHTGATTPLFVFGREGGNIRPFKVTIGADGTVAGTLTNAHIQLSPDTLNGLMKLARAEGFFTLPNRIVGHGLPDIAGRYISVTTANGVTKSVHVRFAHNAAFDQLYGVLSAVVGQY